MKPGDVVWIPAIIADGPLEGYEHLTDTTWVYGGTTNPFGNDTDRTLVHHPALPAVARVLVNRPKLNDAIRCALMYLQPIADNLAEAGLPTLGEDMAVVDLSELLAALSQEERDGR